jgi:cardiolipin synthase
MNLPNLVSLARLLSAPLAVWLILAGELALCFWVFLAAALSDVLDGLLAKRFDARTELGAYLDPLADKALLVSVYVTLGHAGHLPIWLVIMVVFRDVLIVGGAALFHLLTRALVMQPLAVSKLNTAAQFALAATVLGVRGFALDGGGWVAVLVYVVALTTLASGAAYILTWARRARAMELRD